MITAYDIYNQQYIEDTPVVEQIVLDIESVFGGYIAAERQTFDFDVDNFFQDNYAPNQMNRIIGRVIEVFRKRGVRCHIKFGYAPGPDDFYFSPTFNGQSGNHTLTFVWDTRQQSEYMKSFL